MIIDRQRADDGGKHRYLLITSKQRASLQARMEQYFGGILVPETGASKYAIQFAPVLLWRFLAEPEWKSSDVP
jgi:hypothetical protein